MLLAALPATPVQLSHACYQFGFEIVVPASWGDELVAQAVLEDLRHRDRAPVIQCTCPLVSERLLANGQHLSASMVKTAPPPVAVARYARHVFSPRSVHLTYLGACPGARHSAIDLRLLPDEFMQMLNERDIVPTDMPTVFDSVLPPDRRRFLSLPGGCPTQEALWQASDGRMLREVTQPTFSTDLAQTLVWREYVMVDVAPSLGCACAGGYSRLGTRCGRVAVMAVEPPRATQPVVMYQLEFAAPTEEPVAAQARNGGEPKERASEREEGVSQPESSSGEEEREHEAPSRVRVRTPSSTLPRAYLAKRRHVSSPPREPPPRVETQQPEPVEEAATPHLDARQPEPAVEDAPPRAHARQPEAESPADEFSPPANVPNEAVTAQPPNEAVQAAPEPPEVPLVIALHIEPEAAPPEEPTTQPLPPSIEPAAEITITAPMPPPHSTEVAESLYPATPETRDAREEDEWGPPVAVAQDEHFETFAPAGGPLRVEVAVYDEIPPSELEAIKPDAVPDGVAPSASLPEVVAQPARTWGDVLIALWLVLVASAVIASLLWRR